MLVQEVEHFVSIKMNVICPNVLEDLLVLESDLIGQVLTVILYHFVLVKQFITKIKQHSAYEETCITHGKNLNCVRSLGMSIKNLLERLMVKNFSLHEVYAS